MGDCIVDACVLHGAGTGSSADGVRCSKVLDAIKSNEFVVICNQELWVEWLSHLNSRYASLWHSYMVSKDLVCFFQVAPWHSNEISAAIASLPASRHAVARKDQHVLSLAVASNAVVISSELRCRSAFVEAGRVYQPISGVYWVSPLLVDGLANWIASSTSPPLNWQLV